MAISLTLSSLVAFWVCSTIDGQPCSGWFTDPDVGDDPPRDRTSELRKKGFEGRRLGPVQMTTDTAVRVTRLVVEGKSMFGAPSLSVNQQLTVLQPP